MVEVVESYSETLINLLAEDEVTGRVTVECIGAGDGQRAGTQGSAALAAQRSRWMRQVASAPNLGCGKDEMFPLTLELIRKVGDGEAADLETRPQLASIQTSKSWRQYSHVLGPMGLVQNRKGNLGLTANGSALLADGSRPRLAALLADRVRLFAEILGLLAREPLTIEQANARLIDAYSLDWTSLMNARIRVTWLEVLGMVEWLGGRKLAATPDGCALFATLEPVTPESLTARETKEAVEIAEPPEEIAAALARLTDSTAAQDARSTYNIWVPSPKSRPNKIENMRTSIEAATDPVEKDELLSFIANEFGLKRSSVESMLPFMRAAGLLQEVKRGVFTVTPVASAWLKSGSDIDFIRLLHANMRFVGELIRAAKTKTQRSEVYREGARYGLNREKVRWLTSFVIEAGLLVETSWSCVQATLTGLRFIESVPLAEPCEPRNLPEEFSVSSSESEAPNEQDEASRIASSLVRASTDPSADGGAPGSAFESSIEDAFRHMGFQAHRIGGSGDTDILVRWYDDCGSLRTAVVDGKSTSSGRVAHGNVSDVAIDTHKEKHSADFVAVIGPSFSGDTILNMALKRQWALITAEELGQFVVCAEQLGLRPDELGTLFEAPDGLARLNSTVAAHRRELEVVSLVISRLKAEFESGEPISARDISLIERQSRLAPSADELVTALALFERLGMDIVHRVAAAEEPKFVPYQIGSAAAAVKGLRALAAAIERGL